jgi:hypothetical protein
LPFFVVTTAGVQLRALLSGPPSQNSQNGPAVATAGVQLRTLLSRHDGGKSPPGPKVVPR